MNQTWSLDALYSGFDDPRFAADTEKLDRLCGEYRALSESLHTLAPSEALRTALLCEEALTETAEKLLIYAELRQSADTADAQSLSAINRLTAKLSDVTAAQTAFRQYAAALPDLDACIASDPLLTEYGYLLRNLRKDSRYLRSAAEETLFSKLNQSGAAAWENLQAQLTSSVPVSYRGQTITLSAVRNLAYDPEPAVRKEAYEAELACYDRIQDAVAFSLNSIKLQVLNECRLRGFSSPLAQALYKARMQQKTLDAMWSAIGDYLPKFREYLRAKAAALGYENGLPWYELFAPMGKNDRKYTVEEARDVLLHLFGSFDESLRAMGQDAFGNAWIDFFPREGKVGGAFCCEVFPIRQSRILTNFDGSFSSIVTLAHELGHAYHNLNLYDQRPLNRNYSMPVAETASTFNENIVNNAARKAAKTRQEKLALLEGELTDACQILCDIYSRYLFETAVFENRDEEFMPASRLCQMMLDAQKAAYGDGLDAAALHPYMWICKSHYYSGSVSFYNFPYAFGGLFARGLYARYAAEGASFVPKYRALLHATSVMDAEDAAAIAGIDLTDKAFWTQSLQSYADEIDEFKALLT